MKVKKTHSTREKVQKKLQRKSEKLKMLHIDASQHVWFLYTPEKGPRPENDMAVSPFFFHLSITSSLQRQSAQPQSQRVRRLKPSSR